MNKIRTAFEMLPSWHGTDFPMFEEGYKAAGKQYQARIAKLEQQVYDMRTHHVLATHQLHRQIHEAVEQVINMHTPKPVPSLEDDIEYLRRVGNRKDASTDMVEHCTTRCDGCGEAFATCWCGMEMK